MKSPMVLIEVQTVSYLGEDEIIRYEHNYAWKWRMKSMHGSGYTKASRAEEFTVTLYS